MQTFAVSRRAEQLRQRVQQRVVATVEDAALRTEIENLESDAEDAPRRVLWYTPMSGLGQIRPHRKDEAWSAGLWQAFFASCVGATVPALVEFPLSTCGSKKFVIDTLGDHVSTCTAHSGAKKAHDWAVDQIADLFRTTHKVKTQQVVRRRGQRCGDIELEGYLTNATGPVSLVLDLHIAHDRWGSSSDPSINGHLHYPTDMDSHLMRLPLTKLENIVLIMITAPPLPSPLCLLFLVRPGGYTVNLCAFYFFKLIGKLTVRCSPHIFDRRKKSRQHPR